MNNYLQWLEKQIEFCLNDQQMQKEHWAFCKAYEAYQKFNSTPEQETLTPYIEHYSNGNIWVKGQHNSNGKKEGVWELFFENGNIHWRTPYKNGKEDGIVERFFENGNIRMRTPYKNGEKDGIVEKFEDTVTLTPHIEHHSNGNIWIKGQHNSNGEREGVWESFYPNGNIQCRIPYKNGEKDGILHWMFPFG